MHIGSRAARRCPGSNIGNSERVACPNRWALICLITLRIFSRILLLIILVRRDIYLFRKKRIILLSALPDIIHNTGTGYVPGVAAHRKYGAG